MPEAIAEAVAEPVEASTATESTVESTETPAEGAESTQTETTEQHTQTQDGKQGGKQRLNLNDAVKKHTQALKAIDPQLAEAVRTASFRLGGFEREFPGGLKEAQALKATIDGIGGADGIRETQEAVQDYQKLEALYEKGSGEFWDVLAESNPAALSSSMPAGLEKWRSVDADGYNHTMAQVMVQTLDGAKFSDTLAAIWERLPENAENKPLREALASMWQTVEGYRKVADKAPERKTSPQDEALSKREQEIAAREQKAFVAPIAQAGKAHINKLVDAEMANGYQWSAESADRQQAIRERIMSEVKTLSKKDKSFADGLDRLIARGDATKVQQHIENFQARVLPGKNGIIERVARLFNVKPKGAGTAVVKTQTPAAKPNGTSNGATKGWDMIPRQPSPGEVDRVRTTADMILDNKAILKNGKRVTWS